MTSPTPASANPSDKTQIEVDSTPITPSPPVLIFPNLSPETFQLVNQNQINSNKSQFSIPPSNFTSPSNNLSSTFSLVEQASKSNNLNNYPMTFPLLSPFPIPIQNNSNFLAIPRDHLPFPPINALITNHSVTSPLNSHGDELNCPVQLISPPLPEKKLNKLIEE